MTLLLLRAGKVTVRMCHDRFHVLLFLVFLVFSLAFATENVTEDEPPPCSNPSQNQTSSSDGDDDDSGEEEPPCIPPVEFEPTEEEQPTDEPELSEKSESADEAEPMQLSLDQDDYNGTNVTAFAGTCPPK